MRNVFAVVPLSLLALAGCRAPLDEEPPVDRETGELSFDHPDFLAKLRDPAGYAGPSRRRGYQPWSICGFSTDFQDVNRYDGTLGVTTRYVWKHEHAVGELQTPEGDAYCSGTSVGDGLFLTASHCVGSAITGDALVLNDEVPFRTGEPWLKVRRHGITVVEDGAGFGVDYALLRIPGLTTRRVAAADPGLGSQVTIIQHPDGMPKQTESGVIAGFTGNFIKYSGLDTLPGSSGSGILDDSGLLVGVHTNGDCGLLGGTNAGMRISAILPVSPVLSALVAGPQPDPAAGDVHVGVSDTTRFLDRGFAQHGDTCGTGAGTCAIGDVDGDGQADLVHFVQDAFGAARVTPARPWSNSAASHFKAPVTGRQEVCRPNRTCRLGDVDGDGRADAVEFANDGAPEVNVALSGGLVFGSRTLWASFCSAGSVCDVADVDGDGRADAVEFTRGATADVVVALSTGTSFGPPTVFHIGFCFGTNECRLGDVDGDGRADAIEFTRGATKDVMVVLSAGTSFGFPSLWHGSFCSARCEVADVTGDGRADAIEFTQGLDAGDVLVAPSTGVSFSASTLWHPELCFAGHTCLAGDVTGDGAADAIALQRGG